MANVESAMTVRQVIMMPVLVSNDLKDAKKIKTFITDSRAYLLRNTKKRMHEGVGGDVWETLMKWTDLIRPDVDTLGRSLKTFTPSDDLLTRALLSVHSMGEIDGAIVDFQKIKMGAAQNGEVSLNAAIQYEIEWSQQVKMTPSSDMPSSKELISAFLEGITHFSLREKVKTFYMNLSPAEKEKMNYDKISKIFCADAREMANINYKFKLNKRLTNSASSLEKIVENAVKNALSTRIVKDVDTQQPLSRGQKRRALSALKNEGGAPRTKCYGCGHIGHGRDKCPNKAVKGFVKSPGTCTQPLKL